jgi:hypothetical protein
VTGAVARPTQVHLDDLIGLGLRRRQRSDLHCVTTWSAVDLLWEGMPFRTVHEVLAARVGIARAVGWVTVTGLDGYRACLRLDDALADDVLLADRLADAPLSTEHGAPYASSPPPTMATRASNTCAPSNTAATMTVDQRGGQHTLADASRTRSAVGTYRACSGARSGAHCCRRPAASTTVDDTTTRIR